MANDASLDQKTEKALALIIADISHFEEKFRFNEDIGEKRMNYFVSLITASIAGLVALHNAIPDGLTEITRIVALSFLLAIGLLTYLRMVRRNQVTDEYLHTLDELRRLYSGRVALENYKPPFKNNEKDAEDVDKKDAKKEQWYRGLSRGGLAPTAAAINAFIVGILVYQALLLIPRAEDLHKSLACITATLLTFSLGLWWARRAADKT